MQRLTRTQIKSLDALWTKLIIERAAFKCEVCSKKSGEFHGFTSTGKPKIVVIQAHHIQSRFYYQLRFEPSNGVALCKSCHYLYAHRDFLGFHEWLMKHRDLETLRFKFLTQHNTKRRDFKLTELMLQSELRKVRDANERARKLARR